MDAENPTLSMSGIIAFEFALGLLALLLGWLFGADPLASVQRGPERLADNLQLIALGAALAVPLLAFFLALDHWGGGWTDSLREVIFRQLIPTMEQAGWSGRAVVSLGAGIGEELLFRGLIQGGLQQLWGPVAALAVASLLFGLGHVVNVAYFVFATLIGLLLGLLLIWTASLVTPIATHAVYDFLALEYLVRQHRREQAATEQ